MLGVRDALDEMPPEAATVRNGPKPATPGEIAGMRPGDDFNQRGDVTLVLLKHGFQPAGGTPERQQLTRPGKDRGISATLYDGRTMRMFSSNSPPFEIDTNYSATPLRHAGAWGRFLSRSPRPAAGRVRGSGAHQKPGVNSFRAAQRTPLEESHRKSYHLSDTATANGSQTSTGGNVRYCCPANRWSGWDKRAVESNNESVIMQLAKRTTRTFYLICIRPERASRHCHQLRKWALATESSRPLKALVKMDRASCVSRFAR